MTPEDLQELTRILPEPYLVLTVRGEIHVANSAAAALLGMRPAKVRGRRLMEFVAGSVEPVREFLRAASRVRSFVLGAAELRDDAGRVTRYRCEAALLSPRTAEHPALLLLRLQPGAEAARRFVALTTHINELTREGRRRQDADAALAVALERAEEANRAKSEFLAAMSHELRTPLNAIAGYAELLEMGIRGPITEQQRDDLARIRRNQRHLLRMINDILNFTKLEAGQVDFDIENVPLSVVLNEVSTLVAVQAEAKALRYEQAPCPRDVVVRADREKLRQIIANLLSNAIKFTPAGGMVKLECDVHPATVAVRVCDTGLGIPADKVGRIFEPFVQLDRGLRSVGEGIGLGLSISRDLAHRMSGELTVASVVGGGSAFTLTLPRVTRALHDGASAAD